MQHGGSSATFSSKCDHFLFRILGKKSLNDSECVHFHFHHVTLKQCSEVMLLCYYQTLTSRTGALLSHLECAAAKSLLLNWQLYFISDLYSYSVSCTALTRPYISCLKHHCPCCREIVCGSLCLINVVRTVLPHGHSYNNHINKK